MYNKKFIAIAVAVLVIITAIGIGVGVNQWNKVEAPEPGQTQAADSGENGDKSNESQPSDDANASPDASAGDKAQTDKSAAPAEEKTPVFIYFVDEADPNYDDAMKVFEELKSEYAEKIEFDLRNVTKDPSILENFSLVKDNTPALIMDGKEGITGMLFKNTNKSDLEAEIEKALK